MKFPKEHNYLAPKEKYRFRYSVSSPSANNVENGSDTLFPKRNLLKADNPGIAIEMNFYITYIIITL